MISIKVFSKKWDLCSHPTTWAQSSLSIFAQKYLHKCKDTYFILQNKYLCIYEDSFGLKILRDDCASNLVKMWEHYDTECSSKSNWLCHLRWINSAAGNRTIKIIFDQYFGYIQYCHHLGTRRIPTIKNFNLISMILISTGDRIRCRIICLIFTYKIISLIWACLLAYITTNFAITQSKCLDFGN